MTQIRLTLSSNVELESLLKRPNLFGRLKCFIRYLRQFALICILSVIALSDAGSQNSAGQINNIRLWDSPDKTRIVFDVSDNIKHDVFSLSDPERLVVDIKNVDLKTGLPVLPIGNPRLGAVRSGSPSNGVLRFVFELKKPLEAHSFVLTPNELYGYRLVLDLLDKQTGVNATQSAITQDAPTKVSSKSTAEPSSVSKNTDTPQAPIQDSLAQTTSSSSIAIDRQAQKVIIALDAGHGGEDPGAIGHRGSREKKITLSIAKRLKKVIDSDSRMQAFLVREGDYYIDLTRRRTMAKERNADIFVSIHADAFTKKSANGLSVFALSQRGATSAMAGALAEKQNAADLIGGVSLANKDPVLAKVLVDLSMTNTISESVNLGGRVLSELGKVGRLHSKRVEQASFVVLKSPDIPSILVETGFITNLAEEKKLRTKRYQAKIANAIYRALGDYIDQTPYYNQADYVSPNFASVKKSRSQRRHRVTRGDSLSSIALKYGTTVRELKRLNKLKSNVAVLGKQLKLPDGAKINSGNSAALTQKPFIHVVKAGESLSKISARYNVTIRALKRQNDLTRNSIYKGQKISIPGGASKPLVSKHKVKRGDTLSEIAEQYGVSVKAIVSVNGLANKVVKLGQTLTIPR